MAYERSIYSDMYSPNNMFGVTNTNAVNNLNNQTAFRSNSFLDNRIKMMQGMEDQGFTQPNLPDLKQRDWDQFQKKQIPLSLDKNLYKDVEGYTANAGNVMNDANILKPDFSKVNKASLIPDNFIENMKRLYGGITNTDAAQTMNTGNKYANLENEAWANKKVIRTPGGEIVVDTESGQVAPDIAGFPGDDIQEQVTETETLDPNWQHQLRLQEMNREGIQAPEKRGKLDMFLQKFGVPPMTQVSDADRAANKQFMQEQGIGQNPQTGRMYGGNWNEASQDFAGKNAPGTSAWGSANFGEMAQKWDEDYGDMTYATQKMKDKQTRIKAQAIEYAQKLQADKMAADAGATGGKTITGGGYRPGDNTTNWNPNITSAPTMIGQGPLHGATAPRGYQQKSGSHHYMRGGRVGYNTGGRVGILAAF